MATFKGCERLSRSTGFHDVKSNTNIVDNKVIVDMFAPDKDTGLPCSDVHIMLQGSLAPELSEFVRRNLMQPMPESSAPDADTALALVRGKNESVSSYQQKVKNFIATNLNVKEDD